MSVREYHGPHAARSSGPPLWTRALPGGLAVLTVLLQIAWPLTSGSGRAALTVCVVWCFFLASASHAVLHRGWAWAGAWAGISLAFGLGVEVLGTRTGWPFGSYTYDESALGVTVAGVPLVIPLAWAMMSYPCLLVGRRLGSTGPRIVLVAAWALASWDLFLDPQMAGEGYWRWESPEPALPGIPGIPALNFLGWLVAALVLMAVLHGVLPDPVRRPPEVVPAALFLWTWIGGVVANVAFLGRPWVGVIGGVAMGLVAVPYALKLREPAS